MQWRDTVTDTRSVARPELGWIVYTEEGKTSNGLFLKKKEKKKKVMMMMMTVVVMMMTISFNQV
jgi:hypothetical protein